MVKHSDQFRMVEHRILVALVKGDGIVRTGTRAELAEHARAQVVFILYQAFFLFAVFCLKNSLVTLIVPFGHAIWQVARNPRICAHSARCAA